MPKKAKELKPIQIKRLMKPGFFAVGGVAGLHLQVKNSNARSWILRVKIGDKRRDVGLGGYPDVGLAEARDRAREAREQIRQGIDPIDARKAIRAALLAGQLKQMTFAEAARLCHEKKTPEFSSRKHQADWINSINRYAVPVIGNMRVADVELSHVVKILEPIWTMKTETATRVRQRIESVLAWATVSGYRTGDNPARWRGGLQYALPSPAKIRKITHFAALPWEGMGTFMAALREREGMSARALEFAILTAARSGEVRLAVWDEIDLDSKIWAVPANRMKTRREHRVPLSMPVIQLLKSLPRFVDSPYIFAAARGGPLSDMSLSAVCRRMKVNAVPHGIARSSFKDWARNSSAYPDEISELCLAHVSSNATRAAYARDELLPKRARLMEKWAKHCGTVPSKADVVPIRSVKK